MKTITRIEEGKTQGLGFSGHMMRRVAVIWNSNTFEVNKEWLAFNYPSMLHCYTRSWNMLPTSLMYLFASRMHFCEHTNVEGFWLEV